MDRVNEALTCTGAKPSKLIVVDMSLPSSEKRLWAFDVSNPKAPKLLTKDYVAHGRGSDPKGTGHAIQFSNQVGSNATSLGLYRVGDLYQGKHGVSYELKGLSPGYNDHAMTRHVVLHSAPYMSATHQGRSLGCPAVRAETLALLTKVGMTNTYLWVDGAGAPQTCAGGAK